LLLASSPNSAGENTVEKTTKCKKKLKGQDDRHKKNKEAEDRSITQTTAINTIMSSSHR
jgi:hypothetical protein